MTAIEAVEPELVVNKKEEPPAPLFEEEVEKGSIRSNTVTSPGCNRKDPQARVPEAAEIEAIESKLVVKKKEEPSVSSPEKRPEKRCVKKDTATSPAFN